MANNLWEAQNLRASFFLSEHAEPTSEMWFAMMGQPADAENRMPKEMVVRMRGKIGRAAVVLAGSPLRIDLHVQPPIPITSPADYVAGDATELIKFIKEKVGALLERLPEVTRVAFGGILLKQAPDREAAYQELSKLVKSVNFTPGMRDLLFRVNWPADQGGVTINRLTTFSTVEFTIAVDAEMGPLAPNAIVSRKDYIQLEFDNNTAVGQAIPKDDLPAIFSRLVAFATENMKDGEVTSHD